MAEIVDGLVVALREGGAIGASITGTEAITGIAEAVKGVETGVTGIDSAFKDISTFLKEGEGGVATLGDETVAELFDAALKEANIVRILEKIGVDTTEEAVSNFSALFERLTKSRIPEPAVNAIEESANDARRALQETENAALDRIDPNTSTPSDVEAINGSKINKFKEFYNNAKSVVKTVATIGGVVTVGVLFGKYIIDYMRTNSGCFLVTKHSDGSVHAEKVRGYSCCMGKSGTVGHPFDKEIRAYLGSGKEPCDDYGSWDCCAGWCTTTGSGGRLAKTKADIKSLTARVVLMCRKATAQEAMAELAKETGKTVADIVGGFVDGLGLANVLRVAVSVVLGGASGWLTHAVTKERFENKKYVSLGISVVVCVVVFALTFYFLRKYNVFSTGGSTKPVSVYHLPASSMFVPRR